jgi:hypothetical protein
MPPRHCLGIAWALPGHCPGPAATTQAPPSQPPKPTINPIRESPNSPSSITLGVAQRPPQRPKLFHPNPKTNHLPIPGVTQLSPQHYPGRSPGPAATTQSLPPKPQKPTTNPIRKPPNSPSSITLGVAQRPPQRPKLFHPNPKPHHQPNPGTFLLLPQHYPGRSPGPAPTTQTRPAKPKTPPPTQSRNFPSTPPALPWAQPRARRNDPNSSTQTQKPTTNPFRESPNSPPSITLGAAQGPPQRPKLFHPNPKNPPPTQSGSHPSLPPALPWAQPRARRNDPDSSTQPQKPTTNPIRELANHYSVP